MRLLAKIKPKNYQKFKKETSVSRFIPYLCHWDGSTILTKKNEFIKVIKMDGFSFETADDDELDIKKIVRNNTLKSFADAKYTVYFHTIRRYQDACIEGEFQTAFAKYTNQQWQEKHKGSHTYINEHYMTIVAKKDNSAVAKIGSTAKKIQHKVDKESWEILMQETYEGIKEIADRITSGYADYGAKEIGIVNTENGAFSEILEFFASLVNCGEKKPIQVTSLDISKYIATNRLYFGAKTIEAKSSNGTKFASIVSIKEYRPNTNAGIMDGFLMLPFNFIISQSYSFTNRMVAISKMKLQQNRLMQADDVAKSQIYEISQALDSAMSGEFAFGFHHMTVLCINDTIKALDNDTSQVVVEFANIGLVATRETMAMEPAYWAQLPANLDYIVRKANINSLNFASFASCHNYPSGKRKGNHWGDAVTILNTTSGTPYFFNFHYRDIGHTMIIGPTGAGKTVIMNFLCSQAQKFYCRMFFFDKDRGAEIFIRAIEGKYSVISKAENTGFNPLKLEDNDDNRTFLMDWFATLVTTEGEILTPEDKASIKQAVEGNYRLDYQDRILRNVAPFFGMGGPGTLASRLEMWYGEGSNAKLFDNQDDIIEFDSSKNFGFEMNQILKDKKSLGPVLLYLFHRINMSLDGTPTVIVLDEAWALIDNPIFGPRIKDWLKVLRKLNAFVIFATQSVEDAAGSDISDTLVQQTATQIFLPNLKATEVYRDVFKLSKREYQVVRTTNPSTRYFLIKQGIDSVVARVDLSGMNKIINVLSGSAETVRILDDIREEYGDKPDDWLHIFWKKVC